MTINSFVKKFKNNSDEFLLKRGDKVRMNNCDYEVDSDSHKSIAILKDTNNNRIAIPMSKLSKMVNEKYSIVTNKYGIKKSTAGDGKVINPGSRGGHIVGYTTGGQPIYAKPGETHSGRYLHSDNTWIDIDSGKKHKSHDKDEPHHLFNSKKDLDATRKLMDKIKDKYSHGSYQKLALKLRDYLETKHQETGYRQYLNHRRSSGNGDIKPFEINKHSEKQSQSAAKFEALKQAFKTAKRKEN